MSLSQVTFSKGIDFVTSEWKKHPQKMAAMAKMGSIGLTAGPALEMLVKGLNGVYKKLSGKSPTIDREAKINFGGAVLLGLCSYNPIPASRLLGVIGFVGYSIFVMSKKESDSVTKESVTQVAYVASKFIYAPMDFVWRHMAVPLFHHVIAPVGKFLSPILHGILIVAQKTLILIRRSIRYILIIAAAAAVFSLWVNKRRG